MAKNHRQTRRKRTERSQHQVIRIDVLPDDVLLEIFDFHTMISYEDMRILVEAWQSLVHVCRRWRVLVFESPRRLNLRLRCTHKTPTRDKLDIWPALPLLIHCDTTSTESTQDFDNIIFALEQSKRVCQVGLELAGWQLEKVLATMQVPFPELTRLRLYSYDETMPVIPDSFLDGSAQRLRFFDLVGIPFPGLPKLLLSATNLVYLFLIDIPHSGYISPEAMVALISALSSLEGLFLIFRSPQSRPDWETRRWSPSKRSVIPALHIFHFKGVIEYIEDLVTFIDAPQLNTLNITFFNQIDFDFPRLAQFINRTPTIRALNEAHVQFNDSFACVGHRYPPVISISCREPDWQLSSIEQVCNSSLHPLSTAEVLYIEHEYRQLVWKDDAIENTLWLQLLLPFTAAKDLYVSKEFGPGIVAALQELVGARITEVLPSLRNIFVEGFEPSGPLEENIGRFVAARLLSDHPISISVWDKLEDSDMELI